MIFRRPIRTDDIIFIERMTSELGIIWQLLRENQVGAGLPRPLENAHPPRTPLGP